MWYHFRPYVSIAERRANAARELKKLEKKGGKAEPVHIEGRQIAQTFWGKAWCDNLESYSDFENRLPRGRTYVRNGSVCDLKIAPGKLMARVCGSELYTIKIEIEPANRTLWTTLKRECSGQIGSLIELLQGKLSQKVMQIISRPGSGLFPAPAEIEMECSCPDMAGMCKHIAATLYGVGARFDDHPELLFVLRKVDHMELLSEVGQVETLTRSKGEYKTISANALSDVFGVDIQPTNPPGPREESRIDVAPVPPRRAKAAPAKRVSKSRTLVKETGRQKSKRSKRSRSSNH